MQEEKQELYLIFVRLIGEENDGNYRYEFIFSDNPDETWGDHWEEKPICLVHDPMPNDEYITETKILKSKIKFDLIQNNCCFSMQDCIDGIIALINENIDDYSTYPEDGRLYFMYGEHIEEVEKRLAMKNLLLE